MTVTPAGWYPDPNDASLLRYWDGQVWTESTSPAAPAAPAGPAEPVPPIAPAEPGGLPSYPDYSAGYGQAQTGVPNPYAQPQNDSNVLSIIGIVCGVLALIICPPLFGIAGLILGAVAMSKKERLAKVALIVSGVGLVGGILIGVLLINSSMY